MPRRPRRDAPGVLLALATTLPTGTVSLLPMTTGFGRVRHRCTLSHQFGTHGQPPLGQGSADGKDQRGRIRRSSPPDHQLGCRLLRRADRGTVASSRCQRSPLPCITQLGGTGRLPGDKGWRWRRVEGSGGSRRQYDHSNAGTMIGQDQFVIDQDLANTLRADAMCPIGPRTASDQAMQPHRSLERKSATLCED